MDEIDQTQPGPLFSLICAGICIPSTLFFGVIVARLLYRYFEHIRTVNPKVIYKFEVLFKDLNIRTNCLEELKEEEKDTTLIVHQDEEEKDAALVVHQDVQFI